jgi:ADP-ribose pyrophosphatase
MPKSRSPKSKPPKQERLISSKVVYKGSVFWVSDDDVLEPNGVRAHRIVVHHTGSVVIMPVRKGTTEPEILLEHQYRHAAKRYLWELPAGRIDAGEKPLPAAKRELAEETGFTAQRWKLILTFFASPGFVAETMSLFLATGLREGVATPEEDEKIDIRFTPLSRALTMIKRGIIQDAKTISGILWLAHEHCER